MRSVTTATLTQAAAGANQPLYFVKIEWATVTSYLCTHSTQTWAGQTWLGSGVSVDGLNDRGAPSRLVLLDPDNAWRALILGPGIRDRRISIWKGYLGALAAGDPLDEFVGYGDAAKIAGSAITVQLGGMVSSKQYSPRRRIGPDCGVNFVGTPGRRIRWNGQELVLEAR